MTHTDSVTDASFNPFAESTEHAVDEVNAEANAEVAAETTPLAALDARVARADRSVREFVVRRPLVALGAALAGGFVIGRLLARR